MKTPPLIFILFISGVLAGCAGVSELAGIQPRQAPPEFRTKKVGLHVNEKPERFYYYGSAASDASDLMAFHLQQILPFNTQTMLQEMFSAVEISEEGPKIVFKTSDLAGYFDVKIESIRYDYPDPNLSNYRADVQLFVEFKTLDDQVIWNGIFDGHGLGFSNTNYRQSDFGRGASAALEEAFQDAVKEMGDSIAKSRTLQGYFSQ